MGKVKSLIRVSLILSYGIFDREAGTAYLALGELRLDVRPGLRLGGIRQQIHDDCTLANGLVNVKQVLAWNPAILLGLLPAGTVFPDTDDDVEPVVAEVETLSVTLRAVANECESVVLEVVLRQCQSCYTMCLRYAKEGTKSLSVGQSARSDRCVSHCSSTSARSPTYRKLPL